MCLFFLTQAYRQEGNSPASTFLEVPVKPEMFTGSDNRSNHPSLFEHVIDFWTHVTVCESKHNLVWLFSAHMWILFPVLLPEKKSEIVPSRGLLLTPWLALWLNLTSVEKTYSVLLPSHTAWDFLRVVSPFVSSTNLFYSSSLYTWTIFSKSPELTGCKPDRT